MAAVAFSLLLLFVRCVFGVLDASDPCKSKDYNLNLNLIFSTQEDVKLASECAEIRHNLIIEKSFPGTFTLPALTYLTGSITVGKLEERPIVEPSSLTGLSFPNLTTAQSIKVFGAADFASLDFPTLGQIGMFGPGEGELYLTDLPALKDIAAFPVLENVTTIVIENTGLKNLTWSNVFPKVTGRRNDRYYYPALSVVHISNNTQLEDINLDTLKRVGELIVWGTGNSSLQSGVEFIAHDLNVTGITSFGTDETGFPQLNSTTYYSSSFRVNFHDNNLTTIVIKGIGRVRDLTISNNPKLEFFSFPQLSSIGGSLNITDNDNLKVINSSSFGYGIGNHTWVDISINLTGVFTDLSWPPPTACRSVVISTTGNASCVPWDEQYRGNNTWEEVPYNCTSNGPHQAYAPRRKKPGNTILPKELAEIIVPSICFALWCACMVWWLVKRRRGKKEKKVAAAQAETTAVAQEQDEALLGTEQTDSEKTDEDSGEFIKSDLQSHPQKSGMILKDDGFYDDDLDDREKEKLKDDEINR